MVLAVVVAFAVMPLTGCAKVTKRVLVIGDSITASASGDIVRMGNNVGMDDGMNRITFSFVATPGIGARHMTSKPWDPDEYWPALIHSAIRAEGDFDAVIVELGSNDCQLLRSPGDYVPDIARVASSITTADPTVHLLWLTMAPRPSTTCQSIIDDDLRSTIASGTYPTLTTLDYGSWAAAHAGCYFPDGIHLQEVWHDDPTSGGTLGPPPADYCNGQYAYAAWLKEELDRFFGPPA